jgi:hypothetical protein
VVITTLSGSGPATLAAAAAVSTGVGIIPLRFDAVIVDDAAQVRFVHFDQRLKGSYLF